MIKENGDKPAAPVDGAARYSGLTKREMFAMAAMQGLLANSTVKLNIGPTGADNSILSGVSVALADALLAELERTK